MTMMTARWDDYEKADGMYFVRQYLREEIEKEQKSQGKGDTELMRACCLLLYRHGHVEDAGLIWEAKNASFDASFAIDAYLLLGAGLESTKKYLREFRMIKPLDLIESMERLGDFEGVGINP